MSNKVDSKRNNLIFYSLLIIVLAITLFALWRIQIKFQQAQNTRITDLQKIFSNQELILSPSEPHINFSFLESEAKRFENQNDFGLIVISKIFGQKERVIYPFYYPALSHISPPDIENLKHDNSQISMLENFQANDKFTKIPLLIDGTLLGNLWIQIDSGQITTVRLIIALLTILLVASLVILGMQLRFQENVITRTIIALDEKARELVRLERLALAGTLAANIFHDLKKPVLNIKNEAKEQLETPSGSPKSTFTHIADQADIFLGILREGGLDRFVRANEEKEFVTINEMLDKSIALVKYEQRNIQIIKNFTPNLSFIFAEPVRVIQVFSNLIINSYQAMQGKGTLVISTWEDNRRLICTLKDDGPGIPKEKLPQIFEPFYTTKPPGEGTGLGLYIVRDIVTTLGGTIAVESTMGKETLFTVSFPIADN